MILASVRLIQVEDDYLPDGATMYCAVTSLLSLLVRYQNPIIVNMPSALAFKVAMEEGL